MTTRFRRGSVAKGAGELFKASFWERITGRRRIVGLSELAKMLTAVSKKCAAGSTEKEMEEGLSRLRKLLAQARDDDLEALDIGVLVSAAMVLVIFFQEKAGHPGWMSDGTSMLKQAMLVFDNIAERLAPKEFKTLLEVIVSTIEHDDAWDKEFLCVDVMIRVITHAQLGPVFIAPLLDIMETMIEDGRIKDARHVVRILYELLGTSEQSRWPRLTQEMFDSIRRLLSIFRSSVRPAADGAKKFAPLNKGLAVCGRRVFERMQNEDRLQFIDTLADWCLDQSLPEECIVQFAFLLEVAAMHQVTQLYQDTLTPSLLYSVMSMIASDVRVVSLFGNRVLHYLIDRNDNRKTFDTPKIFYQDTSFPIEVGCYFADDKNYLRRNRGLIHDSIMKAFVTHGYHKHNLEVALKAPNIDERLRWHFHAVIMAVMSLLAWVNQGIELFKYLNLIMKRRADEAPHLSPPLRMIYEFAPHQVKWDRSDLFFETWEVRYGLWMHFRKREKSAPTEGEGGEGKTQKQVM